MVVVKPVQRHRSQLHQVKNQKQPEAIESNPVVTVVRAGVNLNTAKSMGVSGVRKVAKAGGSFSNLRHVSKEIGKGTVDHTHVISALMPAYLEEMVQIFIFQGCGKSGWW